MNIEFNEKETFVIKELGKMTGLNDERVIIQALRTYQLVVTGHAKLIKTFSKTCKLCKELEDDKASDIDKERFEYEKG